MKLTRRCRIALVACLAGLTTGLSAQRPTPEQEKAIYAIEYAWSQACLNRDPSKLEALLLDGYVSTRARGIVASKADDVNDVRTDTAHYTQLTNHEMSIKVFGDTAIVTGRAVLRATQGEEVLDGIFQFTDTLLFREGQWRPVATHTTRIAETANSAVEPMPRDAAWVRRHEGFVRLGREEKVDVLFIGDSITDFWRDAKRGLPVWEREFAPLKAANFGISGDRTQHVLWRIQNGELDHVSPKVVVLMIGTNNTGLERDELTPRNSPEEALEGITAIVGEIRERLPNAKLLLHAVFPRGEQPSHPQRAQIQTINAGLAKLAEAQHLPFLDVGPKFLADDGTLPAEVMPDFLHPGLKGYEIWAEALKPRLLELLK